MVRSCFVSYSSSGSMVAPIQSLIESIAPICVARRAFGIRSCVDTRIAIITLVLVGVDTIMVSITEGNPMRLKAWRLVPVVTIPSRGR
jgi:hypothetical protein